MPDYTWSAGVGADWTTAGDWDVGAVPDAAGASVFLTLPGSYAVSIAAGESETAGALSLDASSATLALGGTLALSGGGLLTLQSGVLSGAGVLLGGTLALSGGVLQMSGGTLDGVTILGTLAPGRFYAVNVLGGLGVLAADGGQPGSIDLTGGALNLLDSETLDHVGIAVGGLYGGLQELAAGNTLTIGSAASLSVAGGTFETVAGTTLDNLGSITLNADPEGASPAIAASFANSGELLIGSAFQNLWSFAGSSFANSGSIEIGGQGKLTVAAGDAFSNTGVITIDNDAVLELDSNLTLAALTDGGSIDNAGGQIVLGGTLDLGGGTMEVASGGLFASVSLSGTVRNGTIAIADGILALPGVTLDAITVLGTLSLGTSGGGYSITAINGLSFAGSGSALLADGGVLTLEASQTLDAMAISLGYGSTAVRAVIPRGVGLNGAGIVAEATLALGAGVSLTTAGSAYITAAAFSNAGQISVGAGQDMVIAAADFANTGGIAIGAGATLELDLGATLPLLSEGGISNSGGTLILSGTLGLAGAVFDAASVAASLGDVALLGVVQGGTLRLDSDAIGYGVPASVGGLSFATGLTLEGVTVQGTLDLSAAANPAGYAGSIAISGGLTLEAAEGSQPGAIDLSAGRIVLLDSETLDHAAILLGAAGVTPATAAITDGGAGVTLSLGGGATLDVAGAATLSAGGIVNAGEILIGGALLSLADSLAASNSGTIAGSGTLIASGPALTNSGLVQATAGGTLVLGSTTLTLPGPSQAGGTYEAQSGAQLDLSLATPLATDAATILLDGAGAIVASYNSARASFQPIEATLRSIAATGTLAVLGGRGFTATNSLAIAGLLQLAGGSLAAPGLSLSTSGRLLGYGDVLGPLANAGSIEASGGLLQIGTLSGAGTLQIDAGSTLELGSGSATALFDLVGGTLQLDAAASFAGTLTGFAPGDLLVLAQTTASAAALVGDTLSVTLATGGVLDYALSGTPANGGATERSDGAGDTVVTLNTAPIGQQNPCFVQGTRILTMDGERPVETLSVGDLVPELTGGAPVRIRWIGHRRVACRRHPRPDEVMPVRIQAGAFGPDLPQRDLYLSPDHAVFAAGRLIPVRYLVNGRSIARMARDAVTYWHVELDAHGVLLAEGLAAESYLDTGNRAAFGAEVVQLHPEFALRCWERNGCAPLIAGGPILADIRETVLGRAASLGHVRVTDPDLCGWADGRLVRAVRDGGRYGFALPRGTRLFRLLSRVGVPAEMLAESGDHRRLGVAVSAIWRDGAPLPLARSSAAGWHPAEPGWRWTDGDATLACRDTQRIEVEIRPIGRYWQDDQAARRIAERA